LSASRPLHDAWYENGNHAEPDAKDGDERSLAHTRYVIFTTAFSNKLTGSPMP